MYSEPISSRVRQLFGLGGFEFYQNPEWSSQSLQYRQKIRNFIFERVCSDTHVLDLERPPEIPRARISISHNQKCGGFALLRELPSEDFTFNEDTGLGFDVELNERCRMPIVRRVCTEGECDIAPNAAALWTAKEAAYKAIPKHRQPFTISMVEVGNWSELRLPPPELPLSNNEKSTSENLPVCIGNEFEKIWSYRICRPTSDILLSGIGYVLQETHQTLAFFLISAKTYAS